MMQIPEGLLYFSKGTEGLANLHKSLYNRESNSMRNEKMYKEK